MNSFIRQSDLLSNFNWARTSGSFGEPLMQMTTPHVPITVSLKPTPDRAQALKCLIQSSSARESM